MTKNIWIITLFPEYFVPLLECGVLGKALRGERGGNSSFHLHCLQLRNYSDDNYKGVDSSPYGGRPGMVMRADILQNALKDIALKKSIPFESFRDHCHTIFPCPRGTVWSTKIARDFAQTKLQGNKDLVFIAGRYEGVDERFLDLYVDSYYSLGDFILTGGELAIMTMIDSSMRFVSGVLGNKCSAEDESFSDGLLEEPQYTRPAEFEEKVVPKVLSSGHHKKINEFNQRERERITKKFRPDLWEKYGQ